MLNFNNSSPFSTIQNSYIFHIDEKSKQLQSRFPLINWLQFDFYEEIKTKGLRKSSDSFAIENNEIKRHKLKQLSKILKFIDEKYNGHQNNLFGGRILLQYII